MYVSRSLESTFLGIFNPKKINIIIGFINKHPNMNANELSGDYLNEHLDKTSKENKAILLLGELNTNVLNCDIHPPTDEFLESL